jgi:ABC-type sugar transport system ATPase subunit
LSSKAKQQFKTVRDAENAGIAIIFQELSLVKELTVAKTFFSGASRRVSASSIGRSFTQSRKTSAKICICR